MRYWQILLNSRMAFSRPPWCEAGWKARSDPLSGKVRLEASRPVLKATTRVVSVSRASTCRSNMSRMCSENESGTPGGAPGISRGSPLVLRASTRSIRRSISRTLSRYRSTRRRSTALNCRLMPATSSATQSRMLPWVRRRRARSSALPPAPNSMSKAVRGLRIIGSGVVGDDQLIESVYAHE